MKKLLDPPNVLTLIRKGTQTFTGDQKVALYYCEAVKKYFSFTYNKNGIELLESNISFIDQLRQINDISEIYFDDNSSLNINVECADHVLDLYEDISEGQDEFQEYLQKSKDNFLKILNYSINRNQ